MEALYKDLHLTKVAVIHLLIFAMMMNSPFACPCIMTGHRLLSLRLTINEREMDGGWGWGMRLRENRGKGVGDACREKEAKWEH